jgi:hypothetical protein
LNSTRTYKAIMSDSESVEVVPIGFLNEELEKEDEKLIHILEEKKPSLVSCSLT